MGMFDTIYFPQPVICLACEATILSTQTKSFDSLLDDFYLGDCIGHAEEMRIVREELYCDACRTYDQQIIYLVVYRGILVDCVADLETAEAQLRGFSFEKLILWYHDLAAKRDDERRERHALSGFMHDLVRWFDDKYQQMSAEEKEKQRWFFFHNRDILENADDPLAAIRAYLEQMEQQETETT